MKWLLATTFLLSPVAAHAAPLTLFFTGLGFGATAAGVLTNIAIGIGLQVVEALLAPRSRSQSVQDAQVNTRLDAATRWQMGGSVAVGGSVGTFAEKDASGNLWYIVAHGDAELTGTPAYILDGISVAVSDGTDGFTAGDVTTADFCLDSKGAQFKGSGTKVPTFRLYTVSPSSSSAYGALPADFTTAFPSLASDFRLAGVCFTIVRCRALDANRYRNAMKWRGALGLGEPSVVMVGNFNRMYDPRNLSHNINDSTTWTAGNGNSAIVWAWWRTARYGRGRPVSEINWAKVAEQANICDQTVLNRAGTPVPLYRCGAAFPDSKPRQECEKEILASADAFVAYDDNGLAYPVVGYYTAPTLSFSAQRDILTAQTQIIDDGEAAVDGVVIYYTEPSLGYTRQPCAPWQNGDWYDGSSAPNYASFDVLTCQDHNQATRLAKAIGKRIAPTKKAMLGTTIKGILAKGQRTIDLAYDAMFTGAYEIISNIEEDSSGQATAFAVVPIASDRWTLSAGEEGAPPSATPVLGVTVPNTLYPAPADLTSGSAAGGVGTYTAQFTTSNDGNQYAVSIYRGTTTTFSAATLVHSVFAGPNFSGYDTETGLAAGTYYIWVSPLNIAGIEGNASGPYTVTIT